ncbi:luciferase domain-containing protein [Actinoallomurus spadix]|uniref:luciferase domain-containing protein n=1 Tax=Actinoallomurus spadix TaxID=79912 RepID=UPI002092A8E0|nr:luciferase family protein [Actinoallomurus spadix]
MAAQLATWPGLATDRPSCGVGRGFAFRGTQILHLHTGDEADLRLTRSFIDRLDQVLAESGQIVVRPGDDWVTVRLDTDTAGSLLISLTSLAIQAAHHGTSPGLPCTREGERPVDTERSADPGPVERGEGTLAVEASERSLPRTLRLVRPLRQR